MSFAALALICLVGLLGPLLALPQHWRIPLVIGQLLAGMLVGESGLGWVNPTDPTFAFLAEMGFALVMFVAGSHVPVRDPRLRPAVRVGALRAAAVGILATGVAVAVSRLFGTGHAAVYAVLLASSSAALVLPIVDSIGLSGPPVLELLPQVAIADAACIVALPLAIDPGHAGRAALGALAVLAAAGLLFLGMRWIEATGLRRRVHRISEQREFALELRVSLTVLFALAALAVGTHISVLLAGFSFGVAVAAVGEPRRLARQLFALSDGFLGPVFFVWLGASLDVGQLGRHPSFVALGVTLGAAAVIVHVAMRVTGQPLPMAGLAAAQLGVPVAAATLGTQTGLLQSGEPAALILGALVTIAVAVAGVAVAPSRATVPPS